jgi:hypothetical protein
MAIASAKDFSIKPASSVIRISSSFLEMDGDSPRLIPVQIRNTPNLYCPKILRRTFLISIPCVVRRWIICIAVHRDGGLFR